MSREALHGKRMTYREPAGTTFTMRDTLGWGGR